MPGRLSATCLIVLAFAPVGLAADYAVLVGVKSYGSSTGLRPLKYSENDVEELAKLLIENGYQQKNVRVLTQSRGSKNPDLLPTADSINRHLELVLDELSSEDSVLLAFAGHGVKFKDGATSYFCPVDCNLAGRSNLLSYESVYSQLKECRAGRKILFSDACRNDPVSNSARSAPSLTRPVPQLPPGSTVALFACKAGQEAQEDDRLKHGVFFYYVLEGLRGKADKQGDQPNGKIELAELIGWTQRSVRDHVSAAPFFAKQSPELKMNNDDIGHLVNYRVLPRHRLQSVSKNLRDESYPEEITDGYAEAIQRIAAALKSDSSNQHTVVWLLDSSLSMQDDIDELSKRVPEFYRILKSNRNLQTTVLGFGEQLHSLATKPESSVREIQEAMKRVEVDASGTENMFAAILSAVKVLSSSGQSGKLSLIVVTDESPSDEQRLEEVIKECGKAKASVFIIACEAGLGAKYQRLRWQDPRTLLFHWITANRGPESALPQALVWDGLGPRNSFIGSGFGSWSHRRVCRQTGGRFLMIPDELESPADVQERKAKATVLWDYAPRLDSLEKITASVQADPVESAILRVTKTLNPHTDKALTLRTEFPVEKGEFTNAGFASFARAARAMALVSQAISILDQVDTAELLASSKRTRASFALLHAECYSCRLRLFDYLLTLDGHATSDKSVEDVKHNRWLVVASNQTNTVTEEQFARLRKTFQIKEDRDAYVAMLEKNRQKADSMFKGIESSHPGTPWAKRAASERKRGYGVRLKSIFRDPEYFKNVRLPRF